MKYRPLQIETDLSQVPPLFTQSWLLDFVESINNKNYQSLTCLDYCNKSYELDRHKIVIRVDVDSDPQKALKMASIFLTQNIKSTFFFRFHSSAYSLFNEENQDIIKKISQTGAEIGLHCEPLFVEYEYAIPPDELLVSEINFLSDLIGQKVKGAACHGDHIYYDLGVNNIDYWKQKTVQEFGLSYEVYKEETFDLMSKSLYVSDSNLDKWKSYSNGILQENEHRNPIDYILAGEPLISVLLHPFLMASK